jgi:uncharacterized membrane protein HdeD (DUF308 family)
MFDTKTSCIVRGIIGVVFGFLALMVPDVTLMLFRSLFGVLIVLGIALFIFLAVTGTGDESIVWFGLAAGLLVIGVLSFIIPNTFAIIFILIIAGIAIYNGFTDIMLALTHPKTKYIVIPVMVLAGFILLGALFYYFPGFSNNLFLSIVGTFALAFGLFSILLGFYRSEPTGDENNFTKISCTTSKYNERK